MYFIKETKRLLASPKRLFYVLVLPLLLFGFFALVFYQGVPRDMPVKYIDYDQSLLSAQLLRMLDATPAIGLQGALSDEAEAKRSLQRQEIYAFVVIPAGFQKNVFKGENEQVLCYVNNQFMLPAGLIQKDFQTTVGMFSSGLVMKKKMQRGQQASKVRAEAQSVKVDEHGLFNPYSNYAYYLLVAFLPMMLQMVVMMVTVYVIGVEFKYQRGAEWLAEAGGSAWRALLGKLLPYTLLLFGVGWWMNVLLFQIIGTPLHTGMVNVVLITCALIVVYQIIGIAIASLFSEFRLALTIGSGFTAIAFSFAAYTFPIEGLPKSMQFLANVFPYAHFMKYYVNRAIKGIPVDMTWQPFLALLLFALLFVVAYPMFVRKIKSGGYERI